MDINTTSDSTANRHPTDLDTGQPVECVERTCDACDEPFMAASLPGIDPPAECPECREPWGGLRLGSVSAVGVSFPDRPLMEFGPLSHGGPA